MAAEEEVNKLLEEHGAVLDRSKKHNVWKFPDGKTFTTSHTPSARNAHDNQLSELRNLLGIQQHATTVGQRRPKRERRLRSEQPSHVPPPTAVMLQAFQKAGLTEAQFVAKDEEIATLKLTVATLSKPQCWFCGVKAWLKRLTHHFFPFR